ncbi:unnamed protein product [Symbiodinium sp. KB8]|nr:unnamed protein product [Symbiodinium sp. KB8]
MSMPPTTDKAGFSEVDLQAVTAFISIRALRVDAAFAALQADVSDKQGVDEDTLSHASSRTVEVMPREKRINSRAMVVISVTSLAGETLLEAIELPEPVTGKQIIEKLPGPTTRFDKLLRDSESLDLPAELHVDGEAPISLMFVRVDAGLLAGLADDTIEALTSFGAIQDAPPGFPHMTCCLSLAKEDKERFSGGGFGGTESTRHVLLLPDGRILAKYHYESDYMEKSGDYNCSCCWEIAEGIFAPTDEPGCLCITWTGWAELRHRSDEPFGPGTITGNWEQKLIDAEHRRVPSTLVPTDQGILNVGPGQKRMQVRAWHVRAEHVPEPKHRRRCPSWMPAVWEVLACILII